MGERDFFEASCKGGEVELGLLLRAALSHSAGMAALLDLFFLIFFLRESHLARARQVRAFVFGEHERSVLEMRVLFFFPN